jgi:hypothetical protein
MSDLLLDVPAIPEEEETVFASSGRAFVVQSEDGHPILKAIGIFIIIICGFGIANGVDYISPESGIVRPHEWINSMAVNAPLKSAIFTGEITTEGEPAPNITVYISMRGEGGMRVSKETITNQQGQFEITNATPGLTTLKLIRFNGDGIQDEVQHRVLLSPPALFEPIGFTNIDFIMPPQEEFSDQTCEENVTPCVREFNYHDQEMEFPLIDQSAAGMYVMVGWAFIGLSLIALGFAITGIQKSSRGLIRTAAILVFFTVGHYYSACIFGLMSFALTFSIPTKAVQLDA